MKIHDQLSFKPDITFHLPAENEEVNSIEQALLLQINNELKGILAQSNGVTGRYGLGLLWNCERILSDNSMFRKNKKFHDCYMPFNHLLFIGDSGNGDQYFLPVLNGIIRRMDVYKWDHENDSREWFSESIIDYLVAQVNVKNC